MFQPELTLSKYIPLTWNDAVNADTASYTRSQEWPGGGRNGVKMYCSPSSGTSSKVALQRDSSQIIQLRTRDKRQDGPGTNRVMTELQ